MKVFKGSKLIQVTAVMLLSLSVAEAKVACHVSTSSGDALVEIDPATQSIKVSGAKLMNPRVFEGVKGDYDGHKTTLITGKGIAVTFENHFGCVRNARIITNFRDGIRKIEAVEARTCAVDDASNPDCL